MPTPTIPEPTKIGGHKDGCTCSTCQRVRAKWLSIPYVQTLRSECERLGNEVHLLSRAIREGVGASQIREAKLTKAQADLAAMKVKLDTAGLSVRNATEERDRALGQVERLTKDMAQLRAGLDEVSHTRNRELAQWDEDVAKLKAESSRAEDLQAKLAETEALQAETLKRLESVTADMVVKTNELATLKAERESAPPVSLLAVVGGLVIVGALIFAYFAGMEAGHHLRMGVAP